MKDRGPASGQDWLHIAMVGAPLIQPRWLQSNIVFLPIGLAVVFAMAIYIPSFSPTLLLCSLLVWPPFAAWSTGLFIWARAHHLTGDPATDTPILLETTDVTLPLQAAMVPVAGLLFMLIGVRCLGATGIIGSFGTSCLILTYFLVLGISYTLLSDMMVSVELDRLARQPATRLGRMLRPGMPSLTVMAVGGLLLSAVLARVGGALLFAGVGLLLVSVYLVQGSVVSLERWRRFRRFMRTERERIGERTTKN